MHTQARTIVSLLALAGCSSDPPEPNKGYVGLFGDDAVAVVDLDAGKVLSTVAVAAPDGVVVTPDGKRVYVSSGTSGQVDVIDTSTDKVTTQIDVGTQPQGLTMTTDGKHVLVSVQGAGTASIIDTTTDQVVAAPAIARAHNSAISADGALGFIASQDAAAPAVDVVTLPAGAVHATLPIDKSPRAVAERAGKLYVTVAGSGSIEVLDAATGELGPAIETGGSPHDIRVLTAGGPLVTVSQTANELEIIDAVHSRVAQRVPTGVMPHWIGLTSDGSLAYVTNETDGTITVIELATASVKSTFSVGSKPRKLAITQ